MNMNMTGPQLHTQSTTSGFYDNQFLKNGNKTDPAEVGAQLESYFFRLILKEMRETAMEDPMFNSSDFQHIRQMQDDEIANLLGAQGNLGIKKMVSEYIQKTQGDDVIQVEDMFQQGGLLKAHNKKEL